MEISPSSPVDMPAAEKVVRTTLRELADEWSRPDLAEVSFERDLFEEIDSFAIVELLLRTESEVEALTGRYIPLASDSVLDADKSPLRRFDRWIAYVAKAIAHG